MIQSIPGPCGHLEAIITPAPRQGKNIMGIICHPHPLYNGNMNNKVVSILSKTLLALNIPHVRFNFRGVGLSDGAYGHMTGEAEDLTAVIHWVKQHHPNHDIWLLGFSFGAYISAFVCNQQHPVHPKLLVSVAPAVQHADFSALTQINCPWFVVKAEKDDVVPPILIDDWIQSCDNPPQLITMEDSSHFFHGKLTVLKERLLAKLTPYAQ